MKKQIYSAIAVSVVLLLMSSIFNSCIQEETFAKATVETSQVTSVTEATATCGGTISSDGGATVTSRGVCWNTSSAPTIDNLKTANGIGSGTFPSNITGLIPGNTYYVRSYAINSVGTSYGNEVTFTTQSGVVGLATTATSSITAYTATSGGTISSDGGAAVTSRGVCWNTSSTPTIDNFNTANGSGSGSFTSNITGLTPGTTYYVRSYATNSVGTSYGNEVSFTSFGTITDIDGNVYTTVTIGKQTWMVENLKTTKYNDGTSIPLVSEVAAWTNLSSSGYCWYNNEAANKILYGALYNWYAVNTGKIAPIGWHVPTNTEWTDLITYLTNNCFGYGGSGSEIAKSMASTFDWVTTSIAGEVGNDQTSNNSTGFAAFPGGLRETDGGFLNMKGIGCWWSSTSSHYGVAWHLTIGASGNSVVRDQFSVQYGYSIRCLRDN